MTRPSIKSHIDVENWFTDKVEPLLTKNSDKKSIIHDQLLYTLYVDYNQRVNYTELEDVLMYNEFQTYLHRAYRAKGWVPHNIGTPDKRNQQVKRYKVEDMSDISFDVIAYCNDYNTSPPPTIYLMLNKQIPGWYELNECWLSWSEPTEGPLNKNDSVF